MNESQNRYAQSLGLPLAILAVGALIALVASPRAESPAAAQAAGAHALPAHHASLDALRKARALKRQDRGVVDVLGADPNLPEAWIYVEDSTLDGNGTEYWIFHSSYVPASPSADKSFSFEYVAGQDPQTLQAALDYIVLDNSHVASSSELVVHKMVSTLVP